MNLPTLNMIDWSILDYELAVAGLADMIDRLVELTNEPRAMGCDGNHVPGGRYITNVLDGLDRNLEQICDRLRSMRFPEVGDDDRRLSLLLKIETEHTEFSLTEFCQKA